MTQPTGFTPPSTGERSTPAQDLRLPTPPPSPPPADSLPICDGGGPRRADALYVFHTRARASRELSRPVWVTGQSGLSKLHIVPVGRQVPSRWADEGRCRTRRVGRTSGMHYATWARSRRAQDQWRSWPWDGRQTRACCLDRRTMPGARLPAAAATAVAARIVVLHSLNHPKLQDAHLVTDRTFSAP